MHEISRDRRSKARRVQDAWEELAPLVNAGYPLKDIWADRPHWNISYRQFTRAVFQLQKRPTSRTTAATPVKEAPLAVARRGEFDPLKNLRDHENRPKGYEYRGTRSAEELI
jgi:hypothetical protein